MNTLTGPMRIQRRRTRGWRMPDGAVYVGRGSRWGNPFIVSEVQTRQEAVRAMRTSSSRSQTPRRPAVRESAGLHNPSRRPSTRSEHRDRLPPTTSAIGRHPHLQMPEIVHRERLPIIKLLDHLGLIRVVVPDNFHSHSSYSYQFQTAQRRLWLNRIRTHRHLLEN